MEYIDDFLNSITMYRLVLYVLTCYLVVALVLSFFNLLPFSSIDLLISSGILIVVCGITNKFFAKIFKASSNVESIFITAFILSLIITPARNFNEAIFLSLVAVLSQGSKYIFAINRKHIFNPAALAIFTSFMIFKFGASWWVGNIYLFPFVFLGGLLILKKIRRFRMSTIFILTSILIPIGIYYFLKLTNQPVDPFFLNDFFKYLPESPIFFFAFIMLTEPQTSPNKGNFQLIYAVLVAALFYIWGFLPVTIYYPLELSILFGNIFSYLVSPKEKLVLGLKEKTKIAQDIYEFAFSGELKFLPGQYLEWTLGQKKPDSRGNRRYFTIASSPTEQQLKIGVKSYPNGSSFKKALLGLQEGDQIVASQLSGEFILPQDSTRKLVFLAGGIGITPFRSIIKFLLDTNQKRDIILLYSNKIESDIVYKDIFDEASKKLGTKVVYVNTDTAGYIDEKMIKQEVPDFKERIFYISGPHSMVDAFEKTLKKMGVKKIKVDFFPGYA